MIAAPLFFLCLMLEQLNVLARGLAGYAIARALGAPEEIALSPAPWRCCPWRCHGRRSW